MLFRALINKLKSFRTLLFFYCQDIGSDLVTAFRFFFVFRLLFETKLRTYLKTGIYSNSFQNPPTKQSRKPLFIKELCAKKSTAPKSAIRNPLRLSEKTVG